MSPGVCLFKQPATEKREEHPVMAKIRSSDEVQWVERQIKRRLKTMTEPQPSDLNGNPLFGEQWHFNNNYLTSKGEDVNIQDVWDQGFTGSGITVGVVDNGVEYTHPDLKANYFPDCSWDFNDNDSDPSPFWVDELHGTAVAGVVAASNNKVCGVGAAFGAQLAVLRLLADPVSEYEITEAEIHFDGIDIYSNSWGPTVPFTFPLSQTFGSAMKQGVEKGRGGKGNIYTWAAGNDRIRYGNSNYNEACIATETICVAAVDSEGVGSWYSSPGASILISAPSKGNVLGLTTTDRTGKYGYSSTDCYDSFGGTSAATPLVAGCIALILEANPELGWRDVQNILAKTARKNDPANSDWQINGAGLNVNHNYGFGVIDVGEAVRAALTWVNLPERKQASHSNNNPKDISDSEKPLEVLFDVSEDLIIESVQIKLSLTHKNLESLTIQLQSPSGTISRLLELWASYDFLQFEWTFRSVLHWAESSKGQWKLIISDHVSDNLNGSLEWSELIIFGHQAPIPRTLSVDTSRYCESSNSVSLSWSQVNASSLVIQSDNKSQPEIEKNVKAMEKVSLEGLQSGNYQASLYQKDQEIDRQIFSLPNCNTPYVSIGKMGCGGLQIQWSGAPSGSALVLRNVYGAIVMTVQTDISKTGVLNVSRPFSSRWVASLDKSSKSVAQSQVFSGSLCTVPEIQVSNEQCSKNETIVTATRTQPGMELSILVGSDPVYSVVATRPDEKLMLQFPREQPYGEWKALISFAETALVSRSFTVSSCVSSPIVNYFIGDCQDSGPSVRVTWEAAPSRSLVGLLRTTTSRIWPFQDTTGESGDVQFNNVAIGSYQAVVLDYHQQIIARSGTFNLRCPNTASVKPPRLEIKDLTSTSVTFKFVPQGKEKPDFYQPRASYDNQNWIENFHQQTNDTYTNINLQPGTEYFFQGRAGILQGSTSDWGKTLKFTTKWE